MAGKLKIGEIARRTGLSVSTVSRVLAGKLNTSARARTLVLDCARSEGVLEAVAKANLLFNRLTVFAPARAFDQRADVFYYRIVQGLREAIAPFDIHMSVCALDERHSDAPLFLRLMSDPANDAAVIIGIDDPAIHEIAADLGKPVVLVNSRDRLMRLDSVMPDHRQVGDFAASHLLEYGHRRILVITSLRRFTLEWRLDGIRDALLDQNIPFDEAHALITTSGFGSAEAEAAMSSFLDRCTPEQMPTAILAGGDFMASGVIRALQARGLSVPRDVSVMSIDGFNLATVGEIELTSVHVAREELGAEALALLQSRLTRPDRTARTHLIGGRLATGASVRRMGKHRGQAVGDAAPGKLYG